MAKSWLNKTWLATKIAGEGVFYPFGNTPSEDMLRNYDFKSEDISILMLGCGDIRHILKTVANVGDDSSTKNISFVINDMETAVIARDLFLMYIVENLDADNDEDVAFLWSVWYNMQLSASHHARMVEILNKLLVNENTQNWTICASTRKRCLQAWTSWSTSVYDVEDVKKKRNKWASSRYWGVLGQMENAVMTGEEDTFVTRETFDLNLSLLSRHISEDVSANCQNGSYEFVSKGTVNINEEADMNFVNATLFRPGTAEWFVGRYCNPFMCYIPHTR